MQAQRLVAERLRGAPRRRGTLSSPASGPGSFGPAVGAASGGATGRRARRWRARTASSAGVALGLLRDRRRHAMEDPLHHFGHRDVLHQHALDRVQQELTGDPGVVRVRERQVAKTGHDGERPAFRIEQADQLREELAHLGECGCPPASGVGGKSDLGKLDEEVIEQRLRVVGARRAGPRPRPGFSSPWWIRPAAAKAPSRARRRASSAHTGRDPLSSRASSDSRSCTPERSIGTNSTPAGAAPPSRPARSASPGGIVERREPVRELDETVGGLWEGEMDRCQAEVEEEVDQTCGGDRRAAGRSPRRPRTGDPARTTR